MTRSRKRVVLTGIGIEAPPGRDPDVFFDNVKKGEAKHCAVQAFDAAGFSCARAVEIRDFEPRSAVKKKKKLKLMGRNIVLVIAAANRAVACAVGLESALRSERFGTTLGGRTRISDFSELEACVLASLDENGEFSYAKYASDGISHVYPLSMLKNLPNMAAAHLSIIWKATGPSNTVTHGASSGLQALGEAFRTIQRGDADVMLAGGSDSYINPLDFVALHRLGFLSPDELGACCRPFDENASGTLPGEGAAVFVLESLEFAEARGARVLGEILGFSEGFEPFLAAGGFDGDPVSRCWRRAVEDACLNIEELGGICLAGMGYSPWDNFELKMARALLDGNDVPLWSSRAHLGFAGAGTSALDTAVAFLSSREKMIPPTANCSGAVSAADGLSLVRRRGRPAGKDPRLVTTYNRGGAVAALVLRAFPERGRS